MTKELTVADITDALDAFGAAIVAVERAFEQVNEVLDQGGVGEQLDLCLTPAFELYILVSTARENTACIMDELFKSSLGYKDLQKIRKRKERLVRRAMRVHEKLARLKVRLNAALV